MWVVVVPRDDDDEEEEERIIRCCNDTQRAAAFDTRIMCDGTSNVTHEVRNFYAAAVCVSERVGGRAPRRLQPNPA